MMSIEVLPESDGKLLATKAAGKLTDEDFNEVWVPRIEEILEAHKSVRILFYMGEDFEGWDAGVVWSDARFGLQHLSTAVRGGFEKIAFVGGKRWLSRLAELAGYLMRGEVQAFEQDELDKALSWVKE